VISGKIKINLNVVLESVHTTMVRTCDLAKIKEYFHGKVGEKVHICSIYASQINPC